MSATEEILCSEKVLFNGQPSGIIVATRQYIATLAAKLVKINYSSINNTKPILSIDDALKSPDRKERVITNAIIEPTEVANDTKFVISGDFKIQGQYHYHMEPQTCVTILTEDGLEIHSATQWLDLVHVAVSQCLKMPLTK